MKTPITEAARLLVDAVSYSYKFPDEKQKLIVDFYLWDMYDRLLDFEPKVAVSVPESTLADLRDIAKRAGEKVRNKLAKELFEAGFVAVVSEFSHAYDMALGVKFDDDLRMMFKRFHENVKDPAGLRTELSLEENAIGIIDNQILSGLGWSREKMLDNAIKVFSPDNRWVRNYGGSKWVRIAKSLKKLMNAKSQKEKSHAIDLVIHLEHNTGSVLNKAIEFSGVSPILKHVLNAKRDLDPNELAELSSIPRRITSMIHRAASIDVPHESEFDKDEKARDERLSAKQAEEDELARITLRHWNKRYRDFRDKKEMLGGSEEDYAEKMVDRARANRKPWPAGSKQEKAILKFPYLWARYILLLRIDDGDIFFDHIGKEVYLRSLIYSGIMGYRSDYIPRLIGKAIKRAKKEDLKTFRLGMEVLPDKYTLPKYEESPEFWEQVARVYEDAMAKETFNFLNAIKDRTPFGSEHPMIQKVASDPRYAFMHWKHNLRGQLPFIEGEKAIAKNRDYSRTYYDWLVKIGLEDEAERFKRENALSFDQAG